MKSFTVGNKVKVTMQQAREHGDWLLKYVNRGIGYVYCEDKADSDGELVFGVKFGRECVTLTETQMVKC